MRSESDTTGDADRARREEPLELTVVVPCRDCLDWLSEQLGALSRQTRREGWEVIVADDGSRDPEALRRLVAAFSGRIPALRVVRSENAGGVAHARNFGARAARGRGLCFPDADDVVAPTYVEAMARALAEHPLVGCRLEYERLNGGAARSSRSHGQAHGLRAYRHPPYLPHASGTSLGVQREVHERIGGFDEDLRFLQDTDYCWRLQLAGVPLTFAPEAMVHYRLRTEPAAIVRQARRYGRYNVLLYKRYRPRGMPRAGWREPLRRWVRSLRRLPDLLDGPSRRSRWLRDAAWNLGRLEGCVRFRVFAP